MKIQRALLSVSDKNGLADLGKALVGAGAELIATGKTATVLREAGLKVTPIEEVSGSPEAFQGRMKTLSFPVCSGILARRGDASDEADLKKLSIRTIDCVVVNFYPFEEAAAKEGITRSDLIEQVDIGGPTLVRAAAKNSPDVLVLTDPAQYGAVIRELKQGSVSAELAGQCAARAWERVFAYDRAIAERLGERQTLKLRYGENPHQVGHLEVEANSPLAWPVGAEPVLTPNELSYNNILDASAAYALADDLVSLNAREAGSGVVIVKHNNPCGVAWVSEAGRTAGEAQKLALIKAWEGDAVSAFGGVLVFTRAIEAETAEWLSERFVELVLAPELTPQSAELKSLLAKRKKLKAVRIARFGGVPKQTVAAVPGGKLVQTSDVGVGEALRSVTKVEFPATVDRLARFGIAVCRSLKSNAIALVREIPGVAGGLQLVGAGQGQPNRVEALEKLAVPRAQGVLRDTGGKMSDLIMVSDAFFPFRDTVDRAYAAGIRKIIQPGGSLKDAESIVACDEHGIAMAFTGVRHFRH